MRSLIPVLGLSSALVLASACDPVLFSAELEIPEVCIGGYQLEFSPVGTEVSGETGENRLSRDDLGLPDSDSFEIKVRVRGLGVAPTSGVDDLTFIDELRISAAAADGASDVAEVDLVDLDQSDLTSDGALWGEPETPVDISAHLESGELVLNTELSGTLPGVAWECSMELCVDAQASYRQPL